MTMSLEELLAELRKLNRADKLRAMQTLVLEFVAQENIVMSRAERSALFDAAQTLLNLLDQDKHSDNA